jgi:hypothetical protein
MKQSRLDRRDCVEKLVSVKNQYLKDHPRAKVETALKAVREKTEKLKIDKWLKVYATSGFWLLKSMRRFWRKKADWMDAM